jgi:hypothetical protein
MVATPVGYKCKECARPLRSQWMVVKPRQLLISIVAAFGAATVLGLMFGLAFGRGGYFFFIGALIFGSLVGEAARRGSGGHREPLIAAIAAIAAGLGAFIGGLGPIAVLLGGAAAALYVTGRW